MENELIIPEWFFQEPIGKKIKKLYNPQPLAQRARDDNNKDDKQLNKELTKKMLNPYYFTDRNLKVGFRINLDSHHKNQANSKSTITPEYPEFGIEVPYNNNKILKELSVIYARLINQEKFRCQTVFLSGYDKQDEDNQLLDETELFFNLNINHNLTESGLDKIDVRSPLEHQIQQQGMKDSGWRFVKINSMIIYFYKTGEINSQSYVKIPEIKQYIEF